MLSFPYLIVAPLTAERHHSALQVAPLTAERLVPVLPVAPLAAERHHSVLQVAPLTAERHVPVLQVAPLTAERHVPVLQVAPLTAESLGDPPPGVLLRRGRESLGVSIGAMHTRWTVSRSCRNRTRRVQGLMPFRCLRFVYGLFPDGSTARCGLCLPVVR